MFVVSWKQNVTKQIRSVIFPLTHVIEEKREKGSSDGKTRKKT